MLKKVRATEQRRLARARRPQNGNNLATPDRQVDPVQHLNAAKRLVHAFKPQHILRHGYPLSMPNEASLRSPTPSSQVSTEENSR